MKQFGENLKRIRENAQLSRKDLAQKIGSTQQSIGLYENGKRAPGLDILRKLAKALNVTTDKLLGQSTPDEFESCKKYLKEIGFDIFTKADGKILVLLNEKGRKDEDLERIYTAANLYETGFSSKQELIEIVENAKSAAIYFGLRGTLITQLLPRLAINALSKK